MAQSEAESSSLAFKVFTFKDDDENSQESLTVTIPEVLDPHFGMYVWPCAVVLAQFLWNRRRKLKNKTVLELGAGVSLPGVVASRLGSSVLLSDSAELPQCLQNCVRSCRANGLQVTLVTQQAEATPALGQRPEVTEATPALGQTSEPVQVLGLSWGHISPRLVSLPRVDIVLGSDVFYDPQDFEKVLVTLSFLFRKNPHAQFWTTYQVRSSDWSLELLLSRWRMSCDLVPLGEFEAEKPDLAESHLPGNHSVQMMVIAPDDGRRSPCQQQQRMTNHREALWCGGGAKGEAPKQTDTDTDTDVPQSDTDTDTDVPQSDTDTDTDVPQSDTDTDNMNKSKSRPETRPGTEPGTGPGTGPETGPGTGPGPRTGPAQIKQIL